MDESEKPAERTEPPAREGRPALHTPAMKPAPRRLPGASYVSAFPMPGVSALMGGRA